ncbi:FadR/GntR family transcriptional regulator [Aestuariibacter sp. A3R04]|uniref:FadR/GntR family transcriptional regulator n=1 Tax=Aestuariibacter sp. A3R04 TaxID=2841571 RepID=UPI001C082C41|nr:FadR/GntR family transcriptional regulator [Aestuariibacter sp. A3R04]MBU3023783.1 FadR family transcriptional regulator [Aestuariibacter sp. A3R04]
MATLLSTGSEKRLYLQIAEKIVLLIGQGEYPVGSRLPAERKLAENFEVSRPTIREAMIALEVSGTVEIRPGSGVYVIAKEASPALNVDESLPGPFEILEARLHFEPEAAALASQRISHQEIFELRQLQKKMQKLEAEDLSATHDLDFRFHEMIAIATRNTSIHQAISWLWALRRQSQLSTTLDRLIRTRGATPIMDDHLKIIDAMQNRDAPSAKRAMQQHIQRVINEFSQYSLDE